MTLAFFQMLQGIGFALGLQSPYTQGQYPLALGFKSPVEARPNPLPAPTPAITPLPTLAGVPAPLFAQTKETAARPVESANTNTEESAPTRIHDGGIAELFARSKQNELSEASQGEPIRPSPRDKLGLVGPTKRYIARA
jgi:hypothetical protein